MPAAPRDPKLYSSLDEFFEHRVGLPALAAS